MLRGGAAESLDVKGPYLEVVADSVGSVGVIVAGLMISVTEQSWWGTGVAVAIGLSVSVRAIGLGREVLLSRPACPATMEPIDIVAALGSVNGVDEVHGLRL